jgi:hypothetical protein
MNYTVLYLLAVILAVLLAVRGSNMSEPPRTMKRPSLEAGSE